MNNVRNWLKKRIDLHALEPDETLYERCHWLTLFVKQLKGERDQLQEENNLLLNRVTGGEKLTVQEQELLMLRDQANQLWLTNAKLSHRLQKLSIKATHLQNELEEARAHEKAA